MIWFAGRGVWLLLLGAPAADPVQDAALALQGKAVLGLQVLAHFVHKMAVHVEDLAAAGALEVDLLVAVVGLVDLPRAEENALKTFVEIPENHYQYNTLGRSREELESMTCDCQYEHGQYRFYVHYVLSMIRFLTIY